MTRPRIACVILAAGGSSRMGCLKQLLPYRGRAMVRHIVEVALASECGPVFVVLGCEAERVGRELQGVGVEIVRNPAWAEGIGSSIAVAARRIGSMSPPIDAMLILLGDQPLITADLLREMVGAHMGGRRVVACEYAQTLGPPVLFGRESFGVLGKLRGDQGAKSLLLQNRDLVFTVPFPQGETDIDTPEDYGRVGSVLFTLRDGKSVVLAPVLPEDRQRIRVGLTRLSSVSSYLRFFSYTPTLSDEQLRYLAEVDQVDHVAWCALDPTTPGLDGLGLGRFVRLQDERDTAEFALAVVDAQQRRGLGTVLLAVLYLRAAQRGIRTLRGLMLPENEFMCRWLRDLGASVRREADVFVADLPVRGDGEAIADTPSGRTFSSVLRALAEKVHGPG